VVSVRYATSSDAAAVADLARELAQSFPFSRTRFDASYAALMMAFERWALERNCRLVALATRRVVPFYVALGYEQSATYLRKVLTDPHHGDRSTAADADAA
jgi:hypothetical protein